MSEAAHPHRHVAFAAVALGTFMSTLDGSVVNVALPVLAHEFGVGLGAVEWVVLSYLLALAALLLNVGRVADVIGRGRVYAVGLVIFSLSSAACAAANSVQFLVGARVVQGIGGAMMNAAGPAILTEVYPAYQRGRVLGSVGLAVSAGLAAGPAIGGFVLEIASWRWIFLPNVPLAAIAAFAILKSAPGTRTKHSARYDFAGAALLALSLGALSLALSFGGHRGFGDPSVVALVAVAIALGLAFVRVERTHPAPVLDLALFRNRVFSGSAAAGLLVFVTVGAVNLVMPFFLGTALGLSTGQMGIVLTALPLALAVVSPFSGWAADRAGSTRAIATTGALLASATLLVLSRIAPSTGPVGIALCLAGIGLSVGIFQSPNTSALMGSVPKDRLGTAGGVVATMRVTGMLVGNAVGAAAFLAAGTGPGAAERGLAIAALVGAGAGLLAAAASLARGRLPAPAPRPH